MFYVPVISHDPNCQDPLAQELEIQYTNTFTSQHLIADVSRLNNAGVYILHRCDLGC